ncbi:MAG: hypothetical protein J5772_03320 [Clostridia bacterium]|nr:hypothetical protein [Clostridia bacterium]
MVLSDVAIEPLETITEFWPYILVGALVIAAVVTAIVLIAKKNKKK